MSLYNVNVRKEVKAEEIEFPPLDETPYIEKISQPGYKAPIESQSNQSQQTQQQDSPFKVPSHIPDEVRAEYNKKISHFDNPEERMILESQEQPEVEEQQESEQPQYQQQASGVEEIEEVEEAPVENTIVNNKKRNQQSINESFRALRLKAEEAERERERYAKESRQKDEFLAQLMAMQSQGFKTQKQEEPDFNSIINSVEDDSLVAGNQFKRAAQENKRYTDKVAQDVAQYKQELQDLIAENKVRARYPDLDKVMSEENKFILSQRAPKAYAAWKKMPDSWDKVEAVYEAIKSYGIDKAIEYKQEQNRIQKNMAKPRAVNSVVATKKESALSNVNSFVDEYSMSEEQRQQEFKEMMRNISRM